MTSRVGTARAGLRALYRGCFLQGASIKVGHQANKRPLRMQSVVGGMIPSGAAMAVHRPDGIQMRGVALAMKARRCLKKGSGFSICGMWEASGMQQNSAPLTIAAKARPDSGVPSS